MSPTSVSPMRNWLLFFHVLGAVAWLGGSIYIEALMAGAARTRDPRTIMRTIVRVIDTNSKLFAVSSWVTLIFGVWLVINGSGMRGFERFWITSALILTLIVIGMGMLFFQPKGKQLAAMIDERGMEDPETLALGRTIGNAGHLNTGILFVVFVLMIFKPTL
jgi:uncharacterized membrane protein